MNTISTHQAHSPREQLAMMCDIALREHGPAARSTRHLMQALQALERDQGTSTHTHTPLEARSIVIRRAREAVVLKLVSRAETPD